MIHSHGLCRSHANRLLKYGDPLAGQRRHRALNGAPDEFIAEAIASDTDDCIVWPFSVNAGGYGLIRDQRAHVVVCEAVHGKRPEGLWACHSCVSQRDCINPRHLRWDTPQADMADRARHGMTRRGEEHGRAKLTWAIVEEARMRYAAGGVSQQALADEYGVAQPVLSRALRGVTWIKV